MQNRVKIVDKGGFPAGDVSIFVNEIEVTDSVVSYTIKREAGELPKVELVFLNFDIELDAKAEVEIETIKVERFGKKSITVSIPPLLYK